MERDEGRSRARSPQQTAPMPTGFPHSAVRGASYRVGRRARILFSLPEPVRFSLWAHAHSMHLSQPWHHTRDSSDYTGAVIGILTCRNVRDVPELPARNHDAIAGRQALSLPPPPPPPPLDHRYLPILVAKYLPVKYRTSRLGVICFIAPDITFVAQNRPCPGCSPLHPPRLSRGDA